MKRFFISLHQWCISRKLLIFPLLILIVVAMAWTASKIGFEEDITQLIPKSEKSEITQKVLQQVQFADKIVVYLEQKENGTTDELTQYATEFIDSLLSKKSTYYSQAYIKEIQGQVNESDISTTLDFVYQHLPLFLNQKDYEELQNQLHKDSLKTITENNYKTLVSPTGLIAKKMIRKDPLGLSFRGLQKLRHLQANDNLELYNGFLVSKDRQNLLLFIQPKLASNETDKNAIFVEKLYQLQVALNQKYKKKVQGEYYGSTIVAVTNANQIKQDIQFTVSIALGILLLILIFFYRKIYVPFILFTPTLVGGLTAITFLYLFKGQISAISLGIGSVLLGITLDYSLHILTHFKENGDKKQLYTDVTRPIIMSSFTTATAFLCLLFLHSTALQDLGIFAAISVIVSALFALFFIPLVYQPSPHHRKNRNVIEKIAAYNYHKSKIFIGFIVLGLLISIFMYKNVFFDNDITKMNYQTEELKSTAQKLDELTNTQSKSIYSISYGNHLDKALYINNQSISTLKKLKDKAKIKSFSSIGEVVLPQIEQKQKIQRWNHFWSKERRNFLQKNLIENGKKLGFKAHTFDPFYHTLNSSFTPISIEDYKQVKTLFIDEFISSKNNFSTVLSIIKTDEKNYKEVSQSLQSSKNQIIIDRKQINETFLGNLKNDFNHLLQFSFLAIILILLFFFRSVELTFITIAPIALTWCITVGIMGLVGIDFNIFNIIISTFIFGLGVDYAIFMTNGLIKQHQYGKRELPTYKTSIFLSVITTILGVGVLIFARHPALTSISWVSIIGILSAMLVTFTFQPLLFKLWVSNRTKKGLAPIRIRTLLHAIILFIFYGLGGIILSLVSITILPLIPISKKIKMKWLHKTMAKLVTITLYANPFVKKKVINPHQETFQKPAIIISNHASFLDTLTIGMATHNVIYLVNDWVHKSPIFGTLTKVAGFYPVSSGIDGSLDHLKEKIRQGYCLVVFPEARRSFNNKVGRFHKGAFFLANQLELDILPLYLHGNSEVQPKRDFIIYDGSLTVEIGERIKYEDLTTFGKTARQQTKNIAAFYKENYRKVRQKIESPSYFESILMSNYHYKSYELFNLVKNDFKIHKEKYQKLSNEIPYDCRIAHIADDYGQLDILLVAKSIDRKITTFISDSEKRTIAQNCYSSTYRGVKYVSDIQNIIKEDTDILIISSPNTEEVERIEQSLKGSKIKVFRV